MDYQAGMTYSAHDLDILDGLRLSMICDLISTRVSTEIRRRKVVKMDAVPYDRRHMLRDWGWYLLEKPNHQMSKFSREHD